MNFGLDNILVGLKNLSRECDWISSTQQFGPSSEKFGSYAIEFWLGHKLGKFCNFFQKMQLNFGWRTFWKCLRNFSKRFKWILAETQMGVVLEIFDKKQSNFGQDTTWKWLRVFSIRCNLISANTQFGNVAEYIG